MIAFFFAAADATWQWSGKTVAFRNDLPRTFVGSRLALYEKREPTSAAVKQWLKPQLDDDYDAIRVLLVHDWLAAAIASWDKEDPFHEDPEHAHSDLVAMLLGTTVERLHERIAEYVVRNSVDRNHRNRSIAIAENGRWRSPKTVHRDR